MKVCNRCNQTKPFGEFNKRKDSPDGFRGECRECNGIKCKNWYWNNRDKSLIHSKTWKRENPDKAKANWSRWKRENPEKANEIQKRYRVKNREKIAIKHKEYWDKFKDMLNLKKQEKRRQYPESNMRQRLKFYKITLEQYDAMREKQNGRCAICSKEYSRFAYQARQRLFIDHCHKTGVVRGLLCQKCNNAIGYLDDRIDLMEKCIEYLKPFQNTLCKHLLNKLRN